MTTKQVSQDYTEPYPQHQTSSDSVYAGVLNEQRVSNLISQIAPDSLLEEVTHRLRGEVRDPLEPGTWKEMSKESGYKISELLIANFTSFLGSILTQNTSLSNYSTDEINAIMRVIIKWISSELDVNAEVYDLETKYTERTRIGLIILNTCFAVFKRAQNGMEAKRIFNSLNMGANLDNGSNAPKSNNDFLKFWA